MAIVGIQSLVYGVEDVAECTRYFEDFGLPLVSRSQTLGLFALDDGSRVEIRGSDDPTLPASQVVGYGVREVVFGVDTQENLDRLAADLGQDRELHVDSSGTVHFLGEEGLPFALRLFDRKRPVSAPDPLNAPGTVNRLNRPRRWRLRARPKTINHVVFNVVDYERGFAFLRDRLGFRLSDVQRGYGTYARADGSNNHHTVLLLNGALPFPGFDGKVRFNHANFGVEDIDEIMAGANHMERCGWPKSHLGLGRHRIDSALFFYLPCPAGGEAEYGADGDYLDDSWIPRDWTNALFGYLSFVHNLPPWAQQAPAWEVKYLEGFVPSGDTHD